MLTEKVQFVSLLIYFIIKSPIFLEFLLKRMSQDSFVQLLIMLMSLSTFNNNITSLHYSVFNIWFSAFPGGHSGGFLIK